MARFYREADCDRSLLEGKTVAVVGYGSQGQAQSLNLRDSGVRVVVGLRKGSTSAAEARREGLSVKSVEEAVEEADVVSLLVPDESHGEVFTRFIAPRMKEAAALCLAHGLSVHFGILKPRRDVDVVMVAPLGAGRLLRKRYLDGSHLPCYVAVQQDYSGSSLRKVLAYALVVGCARAGILETTFRDEAEVDLFGEQAVLCGGIGYLLLRAFEVLVGAGCDPEMAYMECVNQLKDAADLISTTGLDGLTESISSPALHGMLTRGGRVAGKETERAMKELMAEIRSGQFVKEWRAEGTAGSPKLKKLLGEWKSHKMHEVGRNLREKTKS
ncbi:MAG: ketol-acid reductoisomerase [Candidatus Eiseniibacteriota bacterium]|nr:MAG: ketol-acid reductoisomerase [Candidatus Eisenbacteria bacterium]